MKKTPKDSQLIGKAKELEIARQLTEEGLLVYMPLVDKGADLVVSDPAMHRFLPIQVKFREKRSGLGLNRTYVYGLRNKDLIFAFIVGSGEYEGTYYIPIDVFKKKAKKGKERKDEFIYFTISESQKWLPDYKYPGGEMLFWKNLKKGK